MNCGEKARTPNVRPKAKTIADAKSLYKRDNYWCICVPNPPRLWRKNGKFVCARGTAGLKVAGRLCDKYLMPLLAETSAAEMVAIVARLLAGAEEFAARQ